MKRISRHNIIVFLVIVVSTSAAIASSIEWHVQISLAAREAYAKPDMGKFHEISDSTDLETDIANRSHHASPRASTAATMRVFRRDLSGVKQVH